MDKAQDKAVKAADKAEDKMDKAGDKTASARQEDRPRHRRRLDQVEDLRAIHGRLEHGADDSDIDVDVENNMVTLNGTVKSAEAKAKAISIAKATDGVKSVKDNLRVGTTR